MESTNTLGIFGFLLLTTGFLLPFGQSLADEKKTENPPQEDNTLPLWEIGFGGAGAYLPHYPAAAQSQARFLPFPWLTYRGNIFRSDEKGVRGRIIQSDKIELDISVSGSLPVSDDDNDARSGMPELDWLGEVGPRLQINMLKSGNENRAARVDFELPVRSVFSTDISDSFEWRGIVTAPSLSYSNKNFNGTGLNFKISAEPIFASEKLMDYFYQVDPQYVQSGRGAYDAEAGYLGSRLSFGVNRKFGRRLSLGIHSNVQNFSGAANSDSPLSLETMNFSVMVGFKHALFQSDTMVSD